MKDYAKDPACVGTVMQLLDGIEKVDVQEHDSES